MNLAENLSKSLYLPKHTRKMNTTDKGSILIVCLFYIITLASGYFIHTNQLLIEKNDVNKLILIINSNEINSEKNSTIVYEDIGESQPTQKVYEASSVVGVSLIYEQKGYEIVHISEFLKKTLGQEVIVTRIWFSKKN